MTNPHLSEHLKNLNPPQLEAVKHFKGPILVLAGAGSGKTRVLTRRVANLVLEQDVKPWNILAVTFTNKATEEMRERLEQLLGKQAEGLWVSTFHSACLKILRSHAQKLGYVRDFVVYDSQDSTAVLKRIVREANIDEKKYPIALFRKAIERAKNSMIPPEQYAEDMKDFSGSLKAEVYDRYQRVLLESNAMDFGDLLFNAVLLFEKFPEALEYFRTTVHFILVDEFQDTNAVQYRFLRLLAEPRHNLLVVGDDDQAIYSFRGATIDNILSFEKDFPETKVIKLEQNYRSTETILEVAHSVIEKNTARKDKKLWTAADRGASILTFVGYDESEEAEFIAEEISQYQMQGKPLREIAIFYRTNAQSRALEEALISCEIPYRIYGGLKFYDRKEVKDILAYLRLMAFSDDNQSFYRIVNNPPRGIGAQTIKKTAELAQVEHCSMWEAACRIAAENKKLGSFVDLIMEFKKISETHILSELIGAVIDKSGYLKRLQDSKDVSAESRIENLKELQVVSMSTQITNDNAKDALGAFLDRVSLSSSEESSPADKLIDQEQEEKSDYVSLMTLHLTKGLEFPVAFLTGMEEGMLPHYRSLEDAEGIDEERRLCYVGITRAMQQLYLTRTICRGIFSAGGGLGLSGKFREPSRFLVDMPTGFLEAKGGGDIYGSQMSYDFEDDEDIDLSEEPHFEEESSFSLWGKRPKKKKKRIEPASLSTADELDDSLF